MFADGASITGFDPQAVSNLGLSAPEESSGGSSSPLGGAAAGAAAGSMLGPWGALAGGALGLVGGILGNKSSAKQAKANRKWQEYMSNTAHQREVRDLRLAGLNPILSAHGGSGASTPSGGVATQQDVISPAVNSAFNFMKMIAETNLKNAETTSELNRPNLISAQSSNQWSGAALNRQQTELAEAQGGYYGALEALVKSQKITEALKRKLMNQDFEVNKAAVAKAINDKQIEEGPGGTLIRYIDHILRAASPAIPLMRRY